MKGGVVLAGGKSRRMGVRKEFLKVNGKNFITTIINTLLQVVDEVVIAIGFQDDLALYKKELPSSIRVFKDELQIQSPLVGIITGLSHIRAPYAIVLACDLPLVKAEVIKHLFKKSKGFDAAIPRWDDGRIEPLFAVYRAKVALEKAKEAVSRGGLRNTDMIERLEYVNYVNIDEFRSIDPQLLSFFNVNTPKDLEELRRLVSKS